MHIDYNLSLPLPVREKHHYLPVFYLKRWTNADGLLCEYRRPYREVKPMMKAPSATGYEIDLYAAPHLPDGRQHDIEHRFMSRLDQFASDALQFMLSHPGIQLPSDLHNGWTRFVMSLRQRNPENVATLGVRLAATMEEGMPDLREKYESIRGPDDPATFDDFKALLTPEFFENRKATTLPSIIDLRGAGTHINGMLWTVVTLNSPRRTLLTCDQPVYFSKGLRYSDAYIYLPIGPVQFFLATNDVKTRELVLAQTEHREFSAQANNIVCAQAHKIVIGSDDTQLRFVENRLRRQSSSRAE